MQRASTAVSVSEVVPHAVLCEKGRVNMGLIKAINGAVGSAMADQWPWKIHQMRCDAGQYFSDARPKGDDPLQFQYHRGRQCYH